MRDNIIKVQFLKPVDGQTEYYFGSIAAIYERFTDEQVGCSKLRLWMHHLSETNPKATKTCVITKHAVSRKPQAKSKDDSETKKA